MKPYGKNCDSECIVDPTVRVARIYEDLFGGSHEDPSLYLNCVLLKAWYGNPICRSGLPNRWPM